ncbi:MAG: SRPBCC family protein [Promethearchaeota archaeon]
MVKFNISTIINQNPEIVWKAFIDPQNMIHWTRFLEKVEIIKGKLGEIGAISHLHYLEKGRSYILEDKLLSYEEGKRIESQVSGQGLNIIVETILESHPKGTKISMTWNGTSKSFFTRIILKLMQGKISKNAKSELDTFKSLVEKYGVSFSDHDLGRKLIP